MCAVLFCGAAAFAQICTTADDQDQPTRNALTAAGTRYFDMVARGDAASLKQNSIASLAANFSGIEDAVKENQPDLSGGTATPRPPYLLKAEGNAPLQRAEFLCGIFNANGQTAHSAEFVIPNLPPGNYGIVILDVSGKSVRTVSFVLQQEGKDWKVGGLYVKNPQINGHDGQWFADHARTYKTQGKTRNAYLYYLEARELLAPVPFMYTQATDRLYDEMQSVKPNDLPIDGGTVDLAAGNKTYKLTAAFPVAVGKDLDVVVKYQAADISNTSTTFQENSAVMKALLTKFPEFRDAFDGVVARAVEPSGRDYGSMLAMKDIK
jgi:hypothetical protein